MKAVKANNVRRWRRRNRVRKKIRGTADCPRLTVFRSNRNTSCQLIDDLAGKTLASVSTQQKSVADALKSGSNCDAAEVVGKALAEQAKSLGIERCCFDRGQYKYHGRVAKLADAAREAGLGF